MKRINEIKNSDEKMIIPESFLTGRKQFDKWFSNFGGIILGCSNYVSGSSGGGKTTLMANIMVWLDGVVSAMYSREMTKKRLLTQVRDLKFHDNAYIADAEDCPTFDDFMKEINELKPKIVIVDSLQVVAKEDYFMKGIMGEDEACYKIIKQLRDYVNKNNAVLFLVGHNTKDGDFAGKNTIMQMMDSHIDIVFDKVTKTRTVGWGQKNRNGAMTSIPFDIKDSQIVFDAEEIKSEDYNAFEEALFFVESIFSNETFLRKATEEQKKEFKKRFEAAKKTTRKSKTGVSALAEDLITWIRLHESLEFNNL